MRLVTKRKSLQERERIERKLAWARTENARILDSLRGYARLFELIEQAGPPMEEDHRALIEWLGRTYGDNDPVWPLQDDAGHPLLANVRLARTWFHVMRGGRMPSDLAAQLEQGLTHKEVPSGEEEEDNGK